MTDIDTCSYHCERPACIRAQRDELRERMAGADADKARLDWLADVNNPIGNVQLPKACVMNNLTDMRAAIDEAMRLDPDVYRYLTEGRKPQ